jgi:hypothetical protein
LPACLLGNVTRCCEAALTEFSEHKKQNSGRAPWYHSQWDVTRSQGGNARGAMCDRGCPEFEKSEKNAENVLDL